jgi:hypothetical protein
MPLIIYVDNYTFIIIIKRAQSLFKDPFFYLGQHYFMNGELGFQALKDNEIVALCFHFPTPLKWLGFDRVDPFPLSFFLSFIPSKTGTLFLNNDDFKSPWG